MKKNDQVFEQLSTLFFEMKQTIRATLPQEQRPDPNAWMRCEMIRFISEHGNPSMREIAKHMRVTAPSATSLVGKLQRLGWIKRTQAQKDKRSVQIVLSKRGETELAHYRAKSRSVMKKVFGGLPDADLRELQRILASLGNQ